MTMPLPGSDSFLRVTRVFAAPRDKVFRAWTHPPLIEKWIISTHHSGAVAEVDLRVGGNYRFKLEQPDGSQFDIVGTYRVIQPPERLVYTWAFEGAAVETGETLVTVEFRDMGDKTEIFLQHEGFPNAPLRDIHGEGWTGCFVKIAELM